MTAGVRKAIAPTMSSSRGSRCRRGEAAGRTTCRRQRRTSPARRGDTESGSLSSASNSALKSLDGRSVCTTEMVREVPDPLPQRGNGFAHGDERIVPFGTAVIGDDDRLRRRRERHRLRCLAKQRDGGGKTCRLDARASVIGAVSFHRRRRAFRFAIGHASASGDRSGVRQGERSISCPGTTAASATGSGA